MIEKKTCYKCGVAKDRSEFSLSNMTDDGFTAYCRDCINAIDRERSKQKQEEEPESLVLARVITPEDRAPMPRRLNRKSKKCGNCGVIKDMKLFEINLATDDGYSSFCKECRVSLKRDRLNKHEEILEGKEIEGENMKTKKCGRCAKIKDVLAFGKNKNAPDKLSYYCKECTRTAHNDAYAKRHKDDVPKIVTKSAKKLGEKIDTLRFDQQPQQLKIEPAPGIIPRIIALENKVNKMYRDFYGE